MTALLDTNIILHYLTNKPEAAAETAAKRFSEAKLGKINLKIPDFIVIEVIYLLEDYYHFSREQIVTNLGNLLSQPFLETENRDAVFEALIEYSHSTVDFVDCLLYSLARENEEKVFSFDKHLDKFPTALHLKP